MKKRKASLPLILGIGLILCSLCILVVIRIRIQTGAQKSQAVMTQINACLPDRIYGTPGMNPGADMAVLEINGVDYCGLLEIPALGITLPISDQWNSKDFYCAPSRFCGSVYDGTLVIGGGDYPKQFAFCDKIENGTAVTVTDMTGARFSYTVSRVDRAKHAQAQWLQEGAYDLVLFCRDAYSSEYIAVRCVFSHHA